MLLHIHCEKWEEKLDKSDDEKNPIFYCQLWLTMFDDHAADTRGKCD